MLANRNIILECRRLTRRVGDEILLSDIDFDVIAGTTTGLFGPSGAGKSVLLRALALLDPSQSGSIEWRGQPLTSSGIPAFRSHFMYVQQKAAFQEGTVLSALRAPFGFSPHRAKRFDQDDVRELLGHFGRKSSFLDKPTGELSGGEAQLVALMRALILAPTVLLLDEPTSALDAETERRVEETIQQWRTNDRAIVFVSHEPSQIRRVSDRIVTLDRGRIQSITPAAEWNLASNV